MAGHVVQRGRQGQRGHRHHAKAEEDQRQAQAHEEQAHVFDRRVGQQALHVGLHGRKHHAEQCRGQAHGQQQRAPPPQLQLQQVKGHAQHAVDGGVEHDPAHQCRNGRRRGRVRFGQPHMQRQDAGLGAKAEHRQQETHRSPEGRQRLRAHIGKGVVARIGLQHAKTQQDGDGAHARHRDVQVARAAHFGDAVVGGDEEVGRQRHGFPHHHEAVGVVGQDHAHHADQEDVVLKAQQARRCAFAFAEVARGEGRDAGRSRTHHQQEVRRQAVQPQVQRQAGQADGQHGHLGRAQQGPERQPRQHQPGQPAQRKQHPRHKGQAVQGQHTGQAHAQPQRGHAQHPVDGEPGG
jgi:hypothetical protein